MKKFLIAAATAVFACFSASAQDQGHVNIGGSLGFTSSTDYVKAGGLDTKSSNGGSFNISAQASYFVIDNLAITFGLGFNTEKTITAAVTGQITSWTNLGSISLGANYYVRLCEKFYWTPGLMLTEGIGASHRKLAGFDVEENAFVNALNIQLVLARLEYKFNDHFSVFGNCGNLGFTTTSFKYDSDNKETTNEWNMDLSSLLALNFGFSYWF